MTFEQHYLGYQSQASCLIADETAGTALVVDPRRDIQAYLDPAADHGVSIDLVIETHFHADFMSGHLELDPSSPAIVYRASSMHSSVAVSLLVSEGFTEVSDLRGGITAWSRLQEDVVR